MTDAKKETERAKRPLKRLVLLVFKRTIGSIHVLVIMYGLFGVHAAVTGNVEAALVWVIALLLLWVISRQEMIHDYLRESLVMIRKELEIINGGL